VLVLAAALRRSLACGWERSAMAGRALPGGNAPSCPPWSAAAAAAAPSQAANAALADGLASGPLAATACDA
jgi:hypothetical protein